MGDVLTNGTTQRAFTVERAQMDHSPPTYEYFRGCQFDGLNIALEAEQVVRATAQIVGLSGAVTGTRFAGATDVAAPAAPVLTASADMGQLLRGGAVIDVALMSLGINIANNLRRLARIGSVTAAGIGNGELSVSGPISGYFQTPALLQAVLADTETSFTTAIGRADGTYLFDLPRVKLSGSAQVQGKNADRMFSGTMQAMRWPAGGYTIRVHRFHSLPALG